MADYENKKIEESGDVEAKDRGLFDFLGKKKEEEKPQVSAAPPVEEEVAVVTEQFEKVEVCEPVVETPVHKVEEEEEKKPIFLEKFSRSDNSSSSVSYYFFFFSLFTFLTNFTRD